MKIFLDTADVKQIKEVKRLGILDGVTTNPSHVAKTGLRPAELYPEICALCDGPVSLETVALEADEIVIEGRELARIADNVVVKVPVMKEGLIAVRRLAEEGIKTNVTVAYSATQALLAAKVGARYISPFIGRLDSISHEGRLLVHQIREIYDNYGFETELLVAAVRNPMHVLDAAMAGADICTMAYDVLVQLYDHPLTDAGIAQFLADWDTVPQ
ncbi:MAG: fructose-6-phosphate aldolase [Spirochaetales bacterium]|nr:fructose-6-phosphate aldolase [Spirochaetales bacterium]